MNLKQQSNYLYNIFYSGFPGAGDWLVLDEIGCCLREKILLLKKDRLIFNREDFFGFVEEVKATDGLGNEEKKHMALKNLASRLLDKLNFTPRQENYFMGLHPDIISSDFSWVIECGTTDPSVVFWYLKSKDVEKVSILPYLFAKDKHFSLYNFLRGQNFNKFIKFKKEELKKVFFRAKTRKNTK
ncbi:MAG TPA: hypothetical protein VMW29_04210 [Candidatus Bathyarchaeia archaeon]|nr:hypothetical protein [Candidatus Bathyarchaeia archaeon]